MYISPLFGVGVNFYAVLFWAPNRQAHVLNRALKLCLFYFIVSACRNNFLGRFIIYWVLLKFRTANSKQFRLCHNPVQRLRYGVDDWRIRVQFPVVADVYFFDTWSKPGLRLPSFLSNVQWGLFSRSRSGRVVQLITHLHVVWQAKKDEL